MKFFNRILGKSEPPPEEVANDDDPIVIVPIPPLVVMLFRLEKDKGSPLTKEEVVAARDASVCMTMTAGHRDQLAERRGYDDVSLDNVWEDWLITRSTDGE